MMEQTKETKDTARALDCDCEAVDAGLTPYCPTHDDPDSGDEDQGSSATPATTR